MRTLGGTGCRARKRNTRDVKRMDPTINEWSTAMATTGGKGGCEATEVLRYKAEETHDRREVLLVPREGDPIIPTQSLCNGDDILRVFEK